MRDKRGIGTGTTMSVGIVAGLVGALLQFAAFAFWFGRSSEVQKSEILDAVASRYVTKEVSETRWQANAQMLSAELGTIKRDLAEVRDAAREIPKILGKLDAISRR